MHDEVAQVRQAVTVSLPALLRRIESVEFRRSFAVKAVAVLTDSEPEVRFAALETLGEVIYAFKDDPLGPPKELLDIYMDNLSHTVDGRDDWEYVTCFNVSPEVSVSGRVLKLSIATWRVLDTGIKKLESDTPFVSTTP